MASTQILKSIAIDWEEYTTISWATEDINSLTDRIDSADSDISSLDDRVTALEWSSGWWDGLGLEYVRKVTVNGSWEGDHWIYTGLSSLGYDAYVVAKANGTRRFNLGISSWDYNYPRWTTADMRNAIMNVWMHSMWLRNWDQMYLYDYNGSWSVYTLYVYKWTPPA